VLVCKGAPEHARDAFQEANRLYRELYEKEWASYDLGRVALALGQRDEALRHLEAALAARTHGFARAEALAALEEACDDAEAFRAFCGRFREEHPDNEDDPLVQWYLEPAAATPLGEPAVHEEFAASLAPPWVWHDPSGDCSATVGNGLEIRAANGRDLFAVNHTAPRILRPISGDFAVQTRCAPASPRLPALGGLLLWKDAKNFLRLERGSKGKCEITFERCLGNKHRIVGRGRLVSEQIFLRLERRGSRVDALCSADGQGWFTVGHADFSVEGPVQVGLHALGQIDRSLYPGAYPEGTAIRFESFDMWG
jgi:tetratricopeptide (TPR) repeat protein